MIGDQPVVGTTNDLWSLLQQADPAALPALWIGCGTEDVLYGDNVRFVETSASAGIPVTTSFIEGEHEWGLWDRQIQEVLAWLPLGKLAFQRCRDESQ